MNQVKLSSRGCVSFTLAAAGVVALMVAGCGSSNGGSGSGGRSGSGGATSGTGGSAAGTGGASASTGGSAAGTGGSAAGTGGSVSGTGGAAAGTGGASSGSGGGAAGAGGTLSGTGGAVTATGGSAGGAGGAGTATGGRIGGSGGAAAGTGGGAGGQGGGRGGLTLTSTSLTNGAAFMPANTCAAANQSPPLTWTAGPAGTQSYAVVLVDTSIARYHWAIWNLAPSVTSLPAALPAGASITTPVAAMQAITGTATPGYMGPCPSGNVHTYVFTVYALDVATLPGVATGVMAQAVFTAIQSHVLASGTLSGTSDATRP